MFIVVTGDEILTCYKCHKGYLSPLVTDNSMTRLQIDPLQNFLIDDVFLILINETLR